MLSQGEKRTRETVQEVGRGDTLSPPNPLLGPLVLPRGGEGDLESWRIRPERQRRAEPARLGIFTHRSRGAEGLP